MMRCLVIGRHEGVCSSLVNSRLDQDSLARTVDPPSTGMAGANRQAAGGSVALILGLSYNVVMVCPGDTSDEQTP